MTTHEKALEAAAKAIRSDIWEREPNPTTERYVADLRQQVKDQAEAAVAAYISALLPEDAAGLVERLESHMGKQDIPVLLADCRQAASLIQSQAARIAELEDTGRFLVDRLDEFDLTDDADEMCQAFIGHVEPAHERFRALLNGERKG